VCGGGQYATGAAASVIAYAREFVGLPYSWGGGGGEGCGNEGVVAPTSQTVANRCGPSWGIRDASYDDRSINGFDCSGLTSYAISRALGVKMARTAAAQYQGAASYGFTQIPWPGVDGLQPGDLIYWSNSGEGGISHTGLYAGEGIVIEAAGHAVGVVERPLNAWGSSMFAARPNYTDATSNA
jgi:cell wall-associated NlpC family hydrolase